MSHLACASTVDASGWCGSEPVEVGGAAGGNQGILEGLMADRRFGAFTFSAERRQVLRDGMEVHLTPKAFDLLTLLIERAPAVVPKPEIHVRLWPDTFVSDATLVGLVKELRRALHDDRQGAIVRTAHRVGYAFADPLQASAVSKHAIGITCWLESGQRRIPLEEGITTIGRDPGSTIWLDVAGVSRRHVQIMVEHGVASLEDLGSKNGTLICDQPVRGRISLRDGDPAGASVASRACEQQADGSRTERRRARQRRMKAHEPLLLEVVHHHEVAWRAIECVDDGRVVGQDAEPLEAPGTDRADFAAPSRRGVPVE
jgi:DNA-binding winged helix-turn-helix (wHTH) protein